MIRFQATPRPPSLPSPGRQEYPQILGVVDRLVTKLSAAEVVYCFWKGSATLDRSMSGAADLDLLADRRQALALVPILNDVGFKRFVTMPSRALPAVEDYLALDDDTGSLVHLHLYHQLVIGRAASGGQRLPWEHIVLSTRVFDTVRHTYVADPDIDLILFMVRAAFELRMVDRLSAWAGRRVFTGARLAQLAWLMTRADIDRLTQVAERLLGETPARLLAQTLIHGPSWTQFLRFRQSAHAALLLHRGSGGPRAAVRGWWRTVWWLWQEFDRRYLHSPAPLLRTSPTGGLMVAFMGADGSGKSTLTKLLASWLSRKIDVKQLYFGSGDGATSLLRWPLQIASRYLAGRSGEDKSDDGAQDQGLAGQRRSRRVTRWKRAARILWALTVSLEKRSRLRQAWLARNRGMIVLCDRFPQSQVMGYNDGPLLSDWLHHRSRFLRALALWESAPYRWGDAHSPDLILRLLVSPDAARQRKPGVQVSEVSRRTEAIRALRYSASTKITMVNSDLPIGQVLREVKRIIWDAM